jgi:5-methylcytosine-specific restriction protein A
MTKIPATGQLTGRAIEEWIGKTPDSKPPPHVVDRIFLRAMGKCHITGRKIRAGEAWEVEHVIALRDEGENRESNMAPALTGAHRQKTAEENSERADVSRKRRNHTGIKTRSPWKPLPGTKASGLRKRMDGSVERW